MKKQNFYLIHSVAMLLVFCFVMVSFIRPVYAKGKFMTFAEEPGNKIFSHGQVRLTLTEYKPDVYTVTGMYILYKGQKRIICPIEGSYFVSKEENGILYGRLSATAHHPELGYDLNVDGEMSNDKFQKPELYVSINDPRANSDRGDPYSYSKTLLLDSKGEVAGPDEEPSPTNKEPKPEEAEAAVPAIEGKEPSSPGTREEWTGEWKGKMKTSFSYSGISTVKDEEVTMKVVKDGAKIRLVGFGGGGEKGKEMVLEQTPSNPNVAMAKIEKTEAVPPDGQSTTKVTLVIFLREGRLYLSQHLLIVGVSKDSTTTIVGDSVGIADRVK